MNEEKPGVTAPSAAPAGGKEADKTPLWRRVPVVIVGTLIFGGLVFFGLGYLAQTFTHESTDDAFLDGNIVSVAPKVSGRVARVLVNDNQQVRRGDLLAEIDPRDLQVVLEQKQAAAKASQANVELVKATVELFRSQIAAAEATAKQTAAEAAASEATAQRAQTDLRRAQELTQNHTISPQEFDTAKATADAAVANLNAAKEKAASDQSKVGQARAQLAAGIKGFERAEEQTRQAELDVQAAALDLSYTKIESPEAGFITRKAVQGGDYVQVGQRLLALVPEALYITANFKETQLRNLRTNQPANVRIDSVAGRTFRAHVDSIQAGSGARFSLLPAENAVGNYVKVVQRVPVKLVFDEPLVSDHVLGPGMSVVPNVHVTTYEISEAVLVIAAVIIMVLAGALWWRAAHRTR